MTSSKLLIQLILLMVLSGDIYAQTVTQPFLAFTNQNNAHVSSVTKAAPLDKLSLIHAQGEKMLVKDGKGRIYVDAQVLPVTNFIVAGALGKHTVTIIGKKGKKLNEITFNVDAITSIDDAGSYKEMFNLFLKSMGTDTGSVVWNGDKYRYFVPWGLDHCHTMKGFKYFLSYGNEFVDLMRAAQREDGMIYSFVEHHSNVDYYRTRDAFSGYTKKIGDKYFVRQPTENHPEYIHVKTIYQCWKASGDDEWMKRSLSSAAQALDYAPNDPARWSKRFGLLKRVYTIDSWDFQVEDEYTPNIGITNTMILDPNKSKFGVFFGDNTGYIMACNQLAEMYTQAGMKEDALKYNQRAEEMTARLTALAWNGNFYTHFIDEDSTVKRNLGVDEKAQLAQSNAYTLNRGLPHDKSKAIIESYLKLKGELPEGSPGEWYAIYPPFESGFDSHGAKWQYMNGGVGGHVAGELARGAFENGYEKYGVDILKRLFELGKKHNNKIYFAYTGAMFPPPPSPNYKPVDITKYANMDTWDKGSKDSFAWMNSKKAGDDFRNLPVGEQTFKNIKFNIIDPAKNNRKAVVAVSKRKGFPTSAEIPVNDSAKAIYMLHTSTKPSSENVSGAISIVYNDGSKITRYMMMGKQLTYWWFSELETERSGIAWYGANEVSKGIGVSWCAIDNPHPKKMIAKIILHSPEDEGIYTVLGITLADQSHYIPVSPISFGGPDNWAAATAMAGLVEGLAGVKDSPETEAFSFPLLSPRWNETKSDTVKSTIRYAPSKGYVSYNYINNKQQNKIEVIVTASAEKIKGHFLLPENVTKAVAVSVNGKPIEFTTTMVEKSAYADFMIDLSSAKHLVIEY